MPTTKLGDKKYYLGIFFKVSMRYEVLLDDHGSNCEVIFARSVVVDSILQCYPHHYYLFFLQSAVLSSSLLYIFALLL